MKYIILILFLLCSYCSKSNGKDTQDLYDERVVLQLLLEPQANPQAKCETMMSKAGQCIPNSSDKFTQLYQFLGNNNEKYTVFVFTPEYVSNATSNQFLLQLDQTKLTYATYCSSAVNTSALSKATNAYKDCIFTCQSDNFTNFISSGVCSQKTASTLATESIGTGQNLCAIKCGKVTNN